MSSRVVAAPIETAWNVLTDHEGMASWAPGLSVTVESPDPADLRGVGVVRTLRIARASRIVEEIVSIDPGRSLGYRAVSGVPFRNWRGRVDLVAEGNGTRASWTLSADDRLGAIGRGAMRLVGWVMLVLFARACTR